jgi:hypothetical protein
MILINDVLKYSHDLFQEGEDAEAYQLPNSDDLKDYAKILCEDINDILQHGDTRVWATIYEVAHYSPLNLVAIHFSDPSQQGLIKRNSSQSKISNLLKEIDQYTYEKFSESLYFRKIVKYYNEDTIFIIKPNEKRFWSRSTAMMDAEEIIIEVSRY